MQTISAWNFTNLQIFLVSLKHFSIKVVRGERSWIHILNPPQVYEAHYFQCIFIEESPPQELIYMYCYAHVLLKVAKQRLVAQIRWFVYFSI